MKQMRIKNKNSKIYKLLRINNLNIHLGDPQGLPDDCFLSSINNLEGFENCPLGKK